MKKSTVFSLGILVAAFCLMSMDLPTVQKGRGGSSCLTETTQVISDQLSSPVLGLVGSERLVSNK